MFQRDSSGCSLCTIQFFFGFIFCVPTNFPGESWNFPKKLLFFFIRSFGCRFSSLDLQCMNTKLILYGAIA